MGGDAAEVGWMIADSREAGAAAVASNEWRVTGGKKTGEIMDDKIIGGRIMAEK